MLVLRQRKEVDLNHPAELLAVPFRNVPQLRTAFTHAPYAAKPRARKGGIYPTICSSPSQLHPSLNGKASILVVRL